MSTKLPKPFCRKLQRLCAKGSSSPPTLTVRSFLWWFGAQRRGPNIVAWIDDLLSTFGLQTVPDYTKTYIDDYVTVKLRDERPVQQTAELEEIKVELSDPVLRIGSLKSERAQPLCVSPNDSLSFAVTLMMTNDFSQLPVITTPREVKGIVSWRSIGERLASRVEGSEVRLFMEKSPYIVSADDSFFETLPGIIANEYVLVRGADGTLVSIFTTTDLSLQFLQLTEPFLLLNEIENHIRNLLQSWSELPKENVREVCQMEDDFSSVFDLTFGNYVNIFRSEIIPDPFPFNIDRAKFCEMLDDVRRIRNDVMHFSADPTPADSIASLRRTSQYLRKLQSMSQ